MSSCSHKVGQAKERNAKMKYNMLQNDGSLLEKAQVLARRLSDATGLLFWVGSQGQSSLDDSFDDEVLEQLMTLEVQVGDELVELVYNPGSVEAAPFTTRLLQALARTGSAEGLGSFSSGNSTGIIRNNELSKRHCSEYSDAFLGGNR